MFRHRQQLIILLFGIMLCGCQTAKKFAHKPLKAYPHATADDPIIETVCMWEPSEGVGLDNSPTRGFAGKLMFFTANHREPVCINGDVRIYVFDDLGTVDEQTKPLHQFDFDQEAFQAFLTETELGAAYQLFVPYTRKGSSESICSLRVKVTPESGRPMYSKLASITLPGTERPYPIAQKTSSVSGIQQASFESDTPKPPKKAPTAEEAAAYFNTATLPRATPNVDADRQRLRTALSTAVETSTKPKAVHPLQQEQPSSQNPQMQLPQNQQPQSFNRRQSGHPLESTELSASTAPQTPPAAQSSRHPLLDD